MGSFLILDQSASFSVFQQVSNNFGYGWPNQMVIANVCGGFFKLNKDPLQGGAEWNNV